MPHSPTLWIAAGLLWILDASINISMEPFRAFVGDQLPPRNAPAGYAMQSFFIGVGAVVASMLPWLLAHVGVSNTRHGRARIPDTVRYAFYLGAACCSARSAGRCCARANIRRKSCARSRTRSRRPSRARRDRAQRSARRRCCGLVDRPRRRVVIVRSAGARPAAVHARRAGRCCGDSRCWSQSAGAQRRRLRARSCATSTTCRTRCGGSLPVQFFSWLALFAMWIYTTAAVTQVHFGATDPHVRRVQRRRELGRRAVRRLQRLRGAGGDRDSVDGATRRACASSHLHQPVARRPRACSRSASSTIRTGCCCRWSASASRGPRSCRCRTRCSPTACRRGRWACTWASSISSS